MSDERPDAARPDHEVILADPLFREGYFEIWRGLEPACDVGWSEAETVAYERGRQFGVVVHTSYGAPLALQRGSLVNPDAKRLLILAMQSGEVL